MACKIVQDYVITQQKLGEGCFGIVYRGYVKDNKNELLAVKTIPLESIRNEEVIRREIEILMKLKSPNIVKFYRPAKTAKHLYFFLEYCEQDLKGYVRSKGRLSESEVREILRQICNGFKVVHGNNVIHRDLKPANFLIHQGVIKISDFGFAREVDNLAEPVIRTFLGSPLYMAPQILAKEKFSSKCDVWSLGITLFELLYSCTPFTAKNPSELLQNIRKQTLSFPQYPKRSQEVKELLRCMLVVEEEKRVSWVDLFDHEYIFPRAKELPPSQDSLELSFAKNELHLAQHRVMTKITGEIVEAESEKSESRPARTGTIEEDIREQTEQILAYVKIEEIDEVMRYKRNVSVFLNVQCNQFFTVAQGRAEQSAFHQALYMLLHKQIAILRTLLDELHSDKPLFPLPLDLWHSYLKSPAYAKITRFVKNDLKHLEDYFAQVAARIDKQPHLADALKDKCTDHQAYKLFFLTLLTTLKVDKYFLIKILITVDPFKYLHPKSNFGLLYENEVEEIDKILDKHPQLRDNK